MSGNARYRWIVDVVEEDAAAVEQDGERFLHVPVEILPPGTGEGDVLVVEVEPSDEGPGTVVRIALDPRATADALRRSREQVRETPPQDDPGGPITL